MKKNIIALIVFCVILIGGTYFFQALDHAERTKEKNAQPAVEAPSTNPLADLIKVTSPKPNGTITSPLTITGEARGTWYFEASFPVELLDATGAQIALTPAQAQADWMTEEFVPFIVTLDFERPTTATGTLVLRKDNPSGLSENDKELRIPVEFGSQ